ncbi:MAG: hypothetical protein ACKOYN_10060 [Planctomycetota bacterium]
MIRFRVHDPNGPSGVDGAAAAGGAAWLRCASIIGLDGRPVRGRLVRQGGVIEVEPADENPAGVALLVDAGGAGRMVLQTCFLPARDEPYDLFIEIARWMIKQFVEASEEWQMFNPARAADAFAAWERSRELFRAALREPDAAAAERLARRAIAHGVDAGEKLTLRHAGILFGARYAKRAASAATLGVCIDPHVTPQGNAAAAARRFDVLALRTPWRAIERTPGKFDLAAVDAWANWAAAERKALVIGPFVDLGSHGGDAPCELPDHVLAARGDAKRFRELVWNHARLMAERYQRAANLFIPVGGANVAAWREEGLDRMVEIVRTTAVAVRDAKRNAKLVLDIQSPGAEGWKGAKGAAWPIAFLQRVVGEAIGFDAASVRFEQGPGRDPARELLTTATLLDQYIGRELPIFVGGFGVPSSGDGIERGAWRASSDAAAGPSAWTEQSQASWAASMLRIALSRPFVEGAWWANLQDVAGGRADGLLDAAGKAKPALSKLLSLRKQVAEPLGAAAVEEA